MPDIPSLSFSRAGAPRAGLHAHDGVLATGPLRRGEVLAVYGLLRPSAGRLASLGFARALAPMGPCRLPGVLLDMGAYPALAPGEGVVAGELVRLLDATAGRRLDAFEECDPANPQVSLYVRRRLRLLNPPREAWVYVWNRPIAGHRRLVSGDWLARAARPAGLRNADDDPPHGPRRRRI